MTLIIPHCYFDISRIHSSTVTLTFLPIHSLIDCRIDDVIEQVNRAEYGVHHLIIYPDLVTVRQIYSNYIGERIKENDEIVLVNPFYETADSVRQVLSEYDHGGIDISKYEREESLIIADALEEYLGNQPLIYLEKGLANYSKMGKKGLSVLADLGAYNHKCKHKDLVDYESSLPTKFEDVPMKGFCLYHQKDFDKFSDEQKQKLIEHHGKSIKIV